jgi:hypothetical protein
MDIKMEEKIRLYHQKKNPKVERQAESERLFKNP